MEESFFKEGWLLIKVLLSRLSLGPEKMSSGIMSQCERNLRKRKVSQMTLEPGKFTVCAEVELGLQQSWTKVIQHIVGLSPTKTLWISGQLLYSLTFRSSPPPDTHTLENEEAGLCSLRAPFFLDLLNVSYSPRAISEGVRGNWRMRVGACYDKSCTSNRIFWLLFCLSFSIQKVLHHICLCTPTTLLKDK